MTAEEDVDAEVEELLEELTEYDDLEAMLDDIDEDIELGDFEEGGGALDESLVEDD